MPNPWFFQVCRYADSGTVLSGLLAAGKIKDPFYRTNEDATRALFWKGLCFFTRTFDVNEELVRQQFTYCSGVWRTWHAEHGNRLGGGQLSDVIRKGQIQQTGWAGQNDGWCICPSGMQHRHNIIKAGNNAGARPPTAVNTNCTAFQNSFIVLSSFDFLYEKSSYPQWITAWFQKVFYCSCKI